MLSITFDAADLASSTRGLPVSVAPMLADSSIARMNRCPGPCVPSTRGPSSASAARPTISSCRNSSRFLRKRWKRLFTCRSSRLRRQSSVLGTSTGRRRSLRKYSAMIPTGTPPSAAQPAGPRAGEKFNQAAKTIGVKAPARDGPRRGVRPGDGG